MESSTIRDKKFLEAMRGYKKEEVDEFLSEVAGEFSRLKKANDELEKKLEVLADKIREYREDEDALRDAIVGAQKQGRAVVDEAKAKAAGIIEEAKQKSDEMIKEAEETVAAKNAEGEKAIADALAEKQRIEDEAAKKAEELHTEMEIQHEIDKEALARTRREAEDFRAKLIIEYTSHIELIKKLPEMCQNEYVKETVDNHDAAKLKGLIAQQKGEEVIEPISSEEPQKEEADEDIKIVNDYSEIPVQEAESEEVTESADDEEAFGGFTVENAFAEDDEDDNVPDFLKNKQKNGNKSKFEKLEFGNNSSQQNSKKKRR